MVPSTLSDPGIVNAAAAENLGTRDRIDSLLLDAPQTSAYRAVNGTSIA
jgi:hypothetical protein